MQPQSLNTNRGLLRSLRSTLAFMGSSQFKQQLKELFSLRGGPLQISFKLAVFTVGAIFGAISFAGVLLGYAWAYNKFMLPKDEPPRLTDLPFIVKFSMFLGGILIYVFLIALLLLAEVIFGQALIYRSNFLMIVCGYVIANIVICAGIFFLFNKWRRSWRNYFNQLAKFASAQWATPQDLQPYWGDDGYYMGGPYSLKEKGHSLLIGSTRAGKGVNIIITMIMRLAKQVASAVIIDVKGELTAITSDYLRANGKKVHVINAWDVFRDSISGKSSLNPLDLMSDITSPHLVDDIAFLSDMIIPDIPDDKNQFFTASARNILFGLILHLITSKNHKEKSLVTIWQWCRMSGAAWDNLLLEMAASTDPVNGHVVKSVASEILKQSGSEETFSSILSNLLEATAFLRSTAIQQALSPGIDPYAVNDGNTIVFIILPVDKLKSASAFLRLITNSLLRACVRRPAERTLFLMDEAASLSYSNEILTALAAYAGYNISLSLVYQDLNQIKAIYGEQFESVIANCTIRQFMNLVDNFSLDYVSAALGDKTNVTFKEDNSGNEDMDTNARRLATPDEVRAITKNSMILFAGSNNGIIVPKQPYYQMPEFKNTDGSNKYKPNPYIANSL